MTDTNVVSDYGWTSSQPDLALHYLSPKVIGALRQLDVRRVLDLGAGNGALCAELSRYGYEVVGAENDEKGVALARAAHPGVPFYRYGIQDDPQGFLKIERPFDAVVSTEVVEHLFSPHLLPQFARRVLRTDGYLIVTTPYHGYAKNLALSILDRWDEHHSPLWHGGHIKFWSRKTLTLLLSSNGFIVQQFAGVGRVPYFWKSMVLVAKKA
jgi:SAM-dependent methyltransferase